MLTKIKQRAQAAQERLSERVESAFEGPALVLSARKDEKEDAKDRKDKQILELRQANARLNAQLKSVLFRQADSDDTAMMEQRDAEIGRLMLDNSNLVERVRSLEAVCPPPAPATSVYSGRCAFPLTDGVDATSV